MHVVLHPQTLMICDFYTLMTLTGIMALSATISYYDMAEISTRILPNIVVLTSDPDG